MTRGDPTGGVVVFAGLGILALVGAAIGIPVYEYGAVGILMGMGIIVASIVAGVVGATVIYLGIPLLFGGIVVGLSQLGRLFRSGVAIVRARTAN